MNQTVNNTGSCIEILPFKHLLAESELELLMKQSNVIRYRKREIIFRQSARTSHIILILNGLVKIVKESRNEKTILLKLAKKGQFIGLLSVMGDQIYQYSATAIEDIEVCMIDINVFRNILMSNGRFALQIINIISQEGLYIFNRLLSQTHKQLPGRLADVLLYFSNEIYNSTRFTFPLTRKELAELAGTTKESFIRTLSEYKHDRIINLEGSRVEILSIDIVKTLSELG
jgi:CRP/FNR family transcriptional regulator